MIAVNYDKPSNDTATSVIILNILEENQEETGMKPTSIIWKCPLCLKYIHISPVMNQGKKILKNNMGSFLKSLQSRISQKIFPYH